MFASRDAGSNDGPGTLLQRVQIIKGWVTADGRPQERIYEVAGSVQTDAAVDLATCEASGSGHDQLCSVWTDPDFDVDVRAFYYARVVENPTCRWSWYACLQAEVDCEATFPPRGLLAACCDDDVAKTIQERAWSSPIWYTPGATSASMGK